MKQLFFLLLVAVAAALNEEVKEEKRQFGVPRITAVTKAFQLLKKPCDESCIESNCVMFLDEKRCGCGSLGDTCSNDAHCCSFICKEGTCRCSPKGFPCKKDGNGCCEGSSCTRMASKLWEAGYGECK